MNRLLTKLDSAGMVKVSELIQKDIMDLALDK